MKLLIFGSRTFNDYEHLKKHLHYFVRNDHVEVVISGACDQGVHTFTRPDGTRVYGADGLGERWAYERGIPVEAYLADWKAHGLAAGPIRNTTMSKKLNPFEDKAIGFHDGKSKGTKDMAKKAKPRVKQLELINYNDPFQ